MPPRWQRLLWPVLYVALACVPLAIALLPPVPPGRSFWIELSLALGFLGIAQMGLEFALISRFQAVSRPFGIDLVMQYHRQIGALAAGIVLLHPLVLAIQHPVYLAMLNPLAGTAGTRTGALALWALAALVVLSFGRRRLGIGYETWRLTHALLAALALGLAFAHVALAGPYLGAPWKVAALGAWCALSVSLIVWLRLVKPAFLRRRPYEVVEVRPEAARTWSVAVAPVGHRGLRFAPGQFAWVRFGVSPWSLREHPFSFSSSAQRRDRIEFGIKELGDFTSTIGRLPPGTRVYLDGPHGSFSSDFQPAPGYLLLAGGIGISPILSMLRTLADRGDRRPHVLVYACSRLDRIAFRRDIESLAGRLSLRVVYVLEEPHEGWEGETGYVSEGLLGRLLSEAGVDLEVFLCGPDPMLQAVEAALRRLGLPQERLHMERFDLA